MGYEVWYNYQDDDYCVWNTISDRIIARNLKTPEEVAEFIISDPVKKEFRGNWIVAATKAKEENYWGIYWIPKTLEDLKEFIERLGFNKTQLRFAIQDLRTEPRK